MSFFLFVDESGFDQRESPYQVLAGVAIRDDRLWPLICAVHEAEVRFFGDRVTTGNLELKGKKLLKTKVFKHAAQMAPFPPDQRQELARQCLAKGRENRGDSAAPVTRAELTALAQAKVAFVEALLDLFDRFEVKAFASIVPKGAPAPNDPAHLRKDYAYLFERYFYFLRTKRPDRERGLVVFDELEKSQCHLLMDQMTLYFRDTATGKLRAERVIPEPFFVHSDLTSAIQLADLVAYIIAWGLRLRGMNEPARPELARLARRIRELQFVTKQSRNGQYFDVWSFKLIRDLRARCQRGEML